MSAVRVLVDENRRNFLKELSNDNVDANTRKQINLPEGEAIISG
jgi:hypothetical protein